MLAWPRFEKLIVSLLEIDRRRARHVVKEIILAVPRKRWTHRWAVTRVIEIVGAGEVLRSRERRCRIAEVWRVIVNKRAAKLPRRATSESDAHASHRHNGGGFHTQQLDSPAR